MNRWLWMVGVGLTGVMTGVAQTPVPVWDLDRDGVAARPQPLRRAGDGVVQLDGVNAFAIPAAVLGDRPDYTIELAFRLPPGFKPLPRMEGAISLLSNRDTEEHAGLAFIAFPPAWDLNGGVSNQMGLEVNGYWNGECGGLEGDGFNTYAIMVKNRSASIYRNGLLLAMTGEIKPSRQPLLVGGRGWRGVPEGGAPGKPSAAPYELRSLKIYDRAIFPAGDDRSAGMMRNVAGESYSMQRADIKDPSLPRILVIGDSISMGYRITISEHFKGRAYVDYWVGGAWLDPKNIKPDDSPNKRAFRGVFANGPYDVVTWNSMTLHMWTPDHPDRCPVESCEENLDNVAAFLRKLAPDTQFIWIRCTPFTTPVPGKPSIINVKKTEPLVTRNAIADRVMKQFGIPEVDLYAWCEKNLDKANADGVHWKPEASRQMAGEIIPVIEKFLPARHRIAAVGQN